MERISSYDIHNNSHRANIIITNEINAVHNDIWIAVDGNKTIFRCDENTKKALDSLYRTLHQMKERGEF